MGFSTGLEAALYNLLTRRIRWARETYTARAMNSIFHCCVCPPGNVPNYMFCRCWVRYLNVSETSNRKFADRVINWMISNSSSQHSAQIMYCNLMISNSQPLCMGSPIYWTSVQFSTLSPSRPLCLTWFPFSASSEIFMISNSRPLCLRSQKYWTSVQYSTLSPSRPLCCLTWFPFSTSSVDGMKRTTKLKQTTLDMRAERANIERSTMGYLEMVINNH